MKMSRKTFIKLCLSTGLLASITLLSACSGGSATHVKANYKVTAEAIPDFQSKNAPISSYWMPDKFLAWSAENDKDLLYNKSNVPLAKRISPEKLSPSNQNQNKKTKIVALSMMNSQTSGNPSRGSTKFDSYTFDYWQYIDTLVYWGGSAGEGIIVTPSADVIDEAHRNGVPVLGTIFLPPKEYGGKVDWVKTMLKKDANGQYPFAKQMVNIAKTYGFEGWFINEETQGLNAEDAANMKALIQQVKKADPNLQIMWYDAMTKDGKVDWQNQLNDQNATFVQDKAADAMFLNFWWTENNLADQKLLEKSNLYAKSHNIDPYNIYAGIDVQAKDVQTPVKWNLLEKGSQETQTSIGLYAASATYTNASSWDDFQNRESAFWVNQKADPRQVDTSVNESWTGLSKYVLEKSAINGDEFKTNFNLGNGYNYFKDGQKISEMDWNDRSLAGILPSYRWMIDNEGDNKITPSFDFANAYNGGNSLKFMAEHLAAGKASTLTLFASDLHIAKGAKFSVNMRSDQAVKVSTILELANGKKVSIAGDKELTDKWSEVNFDIKKYEDQKIEKIALKLTADKSMDFKAINLGEMTLTNSQKVKQISLSDAKVTDEAFEEEGTVGGFRLSWQSDANKNNLYGYEIYQLNDDGSKEFLGASNINAFFVNALKRGKNINSTKFEIVPINKSGEAGHSVTTSIKWPDNSLPKAAFVADKTVVKVGEQVTLLNQSNLATTKYKWEIEGASPATSTEKNPQVSFAKAGTYSVKLTAINEKGQENTISQTALITVLDQPVELTNFALNQSVKVDSYTNESESGPKAVDGKLDTKWCAVGPSKHNITIDLGKSEKINQVLIDHAQKGGESPDMNTSDYTIELSNDNQNWTEVVNVKKNKLGETKDSFKQTEARYVRITAIKPTQGADSAVRLYEIQVLGLKNS